MNLYLAQERLVKMISWKRLLRYIGIRGGLRSLYNTIQHDATILCTSNSLVEIAQSASISGAPLVLGYNEANEDHPLRARALLSMGSDSELIMSGGEGVLVGPGSILRIDGEVTLGDCFINSDSRIICEENIVIGDGVSISWNVNILDSNRHDIIKSGGSSQKTAPIHIKDRVLIGHSACISKGVTIGESSIVAAGSVVIDDIPSNKIVAGNPATVIDSVQNWH